MKVLVVDGFGLSSSGRLGWNAFRRCISHLLERHLPNAIIIFRRCDNISDFLHPELLLVDNKGRNAEDIENIRMRDGVQTTMNCMRYDELSMICVGGDMKEILPWDLNVSQVNALLFQASLFDTPVYGSGLGAFAGVYTIATQGRQFNMTNGPLGDCLDRLDAYPRYSLDTRIPSCSSSSSSSACLHSVRGGWLSYDTGDIYSFDPKNQVWRGQCNIGIQRIDFSKLDSEREQHDGIIATIRSDQLAKVRHDQLVENIFLLDIYEQSFDVRHTSDWRLQGAGAIVSHGDLVVIVDDANGHPIVLSHRSQLFCACVLDEGIGFSTWERMFKNVCKLAMERETSQSLKFMREFDIRKFNRADMWPSYSQNLIATTLPSGPVPIYSLSQTTTHTLKPESIARISRSRNDNGNVSNRSRSQRFHGPLKNFVNTGIVSISNTNTVGYIESLIKSRSERYLLVKAYDNGWHVPKHRCKEIRPPEPWQQEALTPWQQLSFDAKNGLAPPTSPSVNMSKESSSVSLKSFGDEISSCDTGSQLGRLLSKQNFLQRRTERLLKGEEMSDMTPTSTPLNTHRKTLSSAGSQSLGMPRNSSPIVRSQPFTGIKFDKPKKVNHAKGTSPYSATKDFLEVGGKKANILNMSKVSYAIRTQATSDMNMSLSSHRDFNEEDASAASSVILDDLDDERSIDSGLVSNKSKK